MNKCAKNLLQSQANADKIYIFQLDLKCAILKKNTCWNESLPVECLRCPQRQGGTGSVQDRGPVFIKLPAPDTGRRLFTSTHPALSAVSLHRSTTLSDPSDPSDLCISCRCQAANLGEEVTMSNSFMDGNLNCGFHGTEEEVVKLLKAVSHTCFAAQRD